MSISRLYKYCSANFFVVREMTGRKKPVPLEEKRKRLLNLISQSGEVYLLPELEKLGSERGIVAQSVKDVLSALVDDNLVESEKIAGSIYFWSFPGKKVADRRQALEEIKKKLGKLKDRHAKAERALKTAKENAEPDPRRDKLMAKLEEREAHQQNLVEELDDLRRSSSKIAEETEIEMQRGMDAANRWTDNVFQIRSWLVEKYQVDGVMLNKRFGIPEDFDYVD
ncbi:unnamed protein product [Notodromas monacha]|uniref:Meiotic nuclear division protein 1 homolog n=1 Tax=Notodromas monacha TaxID=399045 RepID=A0A7R9BPW5_9CRUS|nr:unnamed protein product [Notodromas monacha]CAG0917981.1 unnamed protein product [Notodromas monacha]